MALFGPKKPQAYRFDLNTHNTSGKPEFRVAVALEYIAHSLGQIEMHLEKLTAKADQEEADGQ